MEFVGFKAVHKWENVEATRQSSVKLPQRCDKSRE